MLSVVIRNFTCLSCSLAFLLLYVVFLSKYMMMMMMMMLLLTEIA